MPSTNIFFKRSISVHTYGLLTTMFRASASNHRQHKHLSCRLYYRHKLYQYAFALKSSELRTKNVLEWLETRILSSSSKSYKLKTNYTHCTNNFNAQVTDDFSPTMIHPLPTNNSVDNNFQALCATSNYNDLNELWSTNNN